MTRLQEIATRIKALTVDEAIAFAIYIHGDGSAFDDALHINKAAQEILDYCAVQSPESSPLHPAIVKTLYEYSGVKYDLEAMGFKATSLLADMSLPFKFNFNSSPQGRSFWMFQVENPTPEGQSYLDDMAAQYTREQKESDK